MRWITTLSAFVAAVPAVYAASPTVTVANPDATVVGKTDGTIDTFNGIPFAKSPTGPLRLKPPQPLDEGLGEVTATGLPPSCPQFFFSIDKSQFPTNVLGHLLNHPFLQEVVNEKEDCLALNIQRPAGVSPDEKLPVLFWIYGGAFELGFTAMYDGTSLVKESIEQGKPVMFVAVNYRLGGFGFMPGAEIMKDGSANLGLLDQRQALKWVADNIEAFGGDPTKVTIWGESAGSISVFDQMVLYEGDHTYKEKPLFRGAIMNSGTAIPADPVDCPKGQAVYDAVVKYAGCDGEEDTLNCLRGLEYKEFLDAANSVPGFLGYDSVALSYLPRPDGTVFTETPDALVLKDKYAKVPFIAGDQEDEGTLFALFQSNITKTSDIVDYFEHLYFHGADRKTLETLVDSYQDISDDGSPFRTGIANNWYPQFKRLAAILGDLTFTLTRRAFFNGTTMLNPDVPSWSYLGTYNYGTPIMGTFHGSDILQVFYGIWDNYAAKTIRGYYFSFVHSLDPNDKETDRPHWPRWSEKQEMMNFEADKASTMADDFRADTFEFLAANIDKFHI